MKYYEFQLIKSIDTKKEQQNKGKISIKLQKKTNSFSVQFKLGCHRFYQMDLMCF